MLNHTTLSLFDRYVQYACSVAQWGIYVSFCDPAMGGGWTFIRFFTTFCLINHSAGSTAGPWRVFSCYNNSWPLVAPPTVHILSTCFAFCVFMLFHIVSLKTKSRAEENKLPTYTALHAPWNWFHQESLQSLMVFVGCISYTLHCEKTQHGRVDYLSLR